MTSTYWHRTRDDYGRSCHELTVDSRTVGVVVRLPKGAIAMRGDGTKYLVNDWRLADRDAAVTYHATLAQAKRSLLG